MNWLNFGWLHRIALGNIGRLELFATVPVARYQVIILWKCQRSPDEERKLECICNATDVTHDQCCHPHK